MKLMELKVKVAQPCPTLFDPMDLVHGILQARIWEWVAFPFSRGSFNPGIEPRSPTLQADSLPAEPPEKLPCKLYSVAKRKNEYMNERRLARQDFLFVCF